jgi:hypothetical protein
MVEMKWSFSVVVAACIGAALMYWYTEQFGRSECPSCEEVIVMRTKGGLLEVSTVRAKEVFTRQYVYEVLGVELGRTVTQIRVPAYYKYQIKLAPEWRVLRTGRTFTVVPPPVMPSLPVAVDLEKLEKNDSGTWIFAKLNNPADMEKLERSITKSLEKRAVNPRYIQLQREGARKTVEEFVRKWLLTQVQWQDESNPELRVLFADEPVGAIERIYTSQTQ